VGHVVAWWKEEVYTDFLTEKPKGRDHVGDSVIDGRIILEKQSVKL